MSKNNDTSLSPLFARFNKDEEEVKENTGSRSLYDNLKTAFEANIENYRDVTKTDDIVDLHRERFNPVLGSIMTDEEKRQRLHELDQLTQERNASREQYSKLQNQLVDDNSNLQYFTQFGGTGQGMLAQLGGSVIGGAIGLTAGGLPGAVTGWKTGGTIGAIRSAYLDAKSVASQAFEDVMNQGGTYEQAEEAYDNALSNALYTTVPETAADIIMNARIGKSILNSKLGKKLITGTGKETVQNIGHAINKVGGAMPDIPASVATKIGTKYGRGVGRVAGVLTDMGIQGLTEAGQEVTQDYIANREVAKAMGQPDSDYSLGGFVDYATSPEGLETMKQAGIMGAFFGGVGGTLSSKQYLRNGLESETAYNVSKNADEELKQLKAQTTPEKWNELKQMVADMYDTNAESLSDKDVYRMFVAKWTQKAELDNMARDESNGMFATKKFTEFLTGEIPNNENHTTKTFDEIWGKNHDISMFNQDRQEYEQARQQVEQTVEQQREQAENIVNSVNNKAQNTESTTFKTPNSKLGQEVASQTQPQSYLEQRRQGATTPAVQGELFSPKTNFVPKQTIGKWTRATDEVPGYGNAPYVLGDRKVRLTKENNGMFYVSDENNTKTPPISFKTQEDAENFIQRLGNGEASFGQSMFAQANKKENSQKLPQGDGDISQKDGPRLHSFEDLHKHYVETKGKEYGLSDYEYMTITDLMNRIQSQGVDVDVVLNLHKKGYATDANGNYILNENGERQQVFGQFDPVRDKENRVIKAIITLYEGADTYTALHEIAHIGYNNMSEKDKEIHRIYAEKTAPRFLAKMLGYEYSPEFEQNLKQALLTKDTPLWAEIDRLGVTAECIDLVNTDEIKKVFNILQTQPLTPQQRQQYINYYNQLAELHQRAIEERYAWEFTFWVKDGYTKSVAPKNIYQRILNKTCDSLGIELYKVIDTAKRLKSGGWEDFQFKDGEKTVAKMYEEMSLRRREEQAQVQEQQAQQQAEQQAEQQMQQQVQEQMQQQMAQEPVQQQIVSQETTPQQMPQETVPQQTAPIYTTEGGSQQNINNIENPVTTPVVNNVQTPDNPQEQQTQQKTEVKKNVVKPRQEVEENKYKNWDDASLIRFLNSANPNEVSYAEINAAYQEARRRGYAKPKDVKNTPLPEIFKNINGEGHWAGRRTKYGEQDLFDIVYQEKNIPSELRNNFPDEVALKLLDKVVKENDKIAQALFNQLPDEQRSRVQQQYIEEANRGVQEETEQTKQLGSTQKETKQQEEVKETKQEAKQETKEEEKVQQEETEQKENAKMLKTNKKDVSFTDNNKRIETTFALMELDDVVPSHTKDNRQLVENPNYPTEYQPRNRKDLKSLQQITEMANKLEPELLGSSPNINGGAPIVLNDGVVINGNARAITLKEVFGRKRSDENQKKYIAYLKKNYEKFGFKPQDVNKFNKPVLVRVLDNKQDIKEISNSFAGGQNLGAVEKAKIDGNTLSESTLKEFKTESDTAFDKDYNHNFFINAINDIVKKFPSRRGDLMTADGGISNDGVETIKRALFARAYNDLELLTSMAEDIGEVRKNIINALTAAAPSVIRADIRMKNGMLHSYDLVKNLIDGVNIINTAVRNDLTAEQYLQQNETAMFGNEEYSPEAIENAKNLDYSRMRRSAKKQTEYIKEIIKGIEEQGKAIEQNLEGKKEEITPLLDLEKQAFEKIFPQENSLFSENTTDTKYQRASQRQEQLQEVANMLETPMVELNIATAKDKEAQKLLKETMMRPENGFTEDEAKDLIKELERIADAVEEISKQYGELYDFQHWKVDDIRDFYEKLNKMLPVRGAFLNNGEYIYNIDLGAMCTKKEAPDLIHQIFVDMGYGQQLGPTQMEAIKDILREQGFLVPCDCCFVEAHRLRMLMTANKLMYEWKSTLMAAGIMDDNKLGDSRTFKPEQYKRLVEMAGRKEGFSYKQAYEKYMPKSRRRIEKVMGIVEKTGKVRKVTIDNGITADRMKEIAQLFLDDPTLAGEFNPDTLLTTKGTDDLLYRYGPNTGIRGFLGKLDGSSSAKLLEHYKPYDELSYFFMDEDKILRDRGADEKGNVDVKRKNKNIYDDGGFRVQSFTDFTPLLFFDYCQMVVGLEARRLPMHAYTKVPSFVMLFGETGMLINVSMVPEIRLDKNIDKDHVGLKYNPETGDYDYAWHPDSYPWKLALKHSKEFPTVGITAVGASKYHILKLLADPNIGQVIPYHKSGMPPQIQIKTGFKYATDYTKYQTTKLGNNEDEIKQKKQEIKDKTGYSADVYLNYSRILFEMRDKYPDSRDTPKLAAQEYLKRCKDFKCTPVFEMFSNEEGYYKLLQDFKSYDADGNPVYQKPVRFKLPDNWVEIFKKALNYREETRKQLDSLKNNEKVLKKVEKVLEKQRLDGAVREIMIRRLKDALGNNNVQSLRNDVFFDTLEAEYAKQMGVEQAKQRIEEFRNKDGWVYGFSSGDKIYLNESLFNANTPAHEFTHIWAKVAQIKNPQLWKEGVELLKTEAKEVWDEVVNDELYANIRGNENAIASEVLARIVGKENEYMVEKLLDPKRKPLTKKSFTEKIRLWVVRLFNEVRSLFDGYNGKPLTYEEFTKMPLRALWETNENKQFRKLLAKARKAKLIENNVSAETNVELMAGGIDRKGGLNQALLENVFKKEFFNAAQPYVSSGLLTRRDVEKLYAVEMKDHSNDYFDHARGVNKNFHKYFTKIHKKVNDKLWRQGMEVQKGFDGKWRFYFSDKKMKIKDDFKKYLTKGYKGPIPKNLKLSDIMEHDLLFKYYPELKDVAVEIVNKGMDYFGVYDDKENKIEINKDLTFFEPLKLDKKSTLSPEEQLKKIKERNRRMENELKGTLVHEPQHAIQTIEGFSTGASVESASNDYEKPFYNLIDEIQRRKEDFMKYLREETSIRSEATFKKMSDLIDDKQKLIDQVRGILRADGRRPKTAMQKYLFDYLYKENEETGERSILYRVYEETLGEQEAFDAERRLNMTEEQEKNTPPLSNYNLKEMKYNEGEFLERKPSPLDEFINGKRPLNTHNDKEILYEDKNGELKVRKEDQDKAQMANDLLNQLNSVLPNKSALKKYQKGEKLTTEERAQVASEILNRAFPNTRFQYAYHSTPHDFNTFTLDHLLEGEGAMVHGWGLYFGKVLKDNYKYYFKTFKSDKVSDNIKITNNEGKVITDFIFEKLDGWSQANLLYDPSKDKIKSYLTKVKTKKESDIKTFTQWMENQEGLINKYKDTDINLDHTIKKRDWYRNEIDKLNKDVKEISSIIEDIDNDKIKVKKLNSNKLFLADIPNDDVLIREGAKFKDQPKKVRLGFVKLFNYIQKELGKKITFTEKEMLEIYGDKIIDYKTIERSLYNMNFLFTEGIDYDGVRIFKDRTREKEMFKEINIQGKNIVTGQPYELTIQQLTSKLLNKFGIKGVSYDGKRDGECVVVFDNKAIDIIDKFKKEENRWVSVKPPSQKQELTDTQKQRVERKLQEKRQQTQQNNIPQGRRYMKATQEPLFKSDNNADIAYELKDFYSVSFKRSAQNNEENKRKMKYFEDNKNFWKKETDKDGTITYSRSKPLDHHKNTVSYSGINGVETGKTTKATLMEWKDWLKGQVIKALFNERYFLAKLARDLGVYDKYEEMIVQSKGGAIAGYVLEHGYTRKDGTKTKAMNKIIVDIGDKQPYFNDYCLAKYVVELQGQGRIMNGEKLVSLKMSVQEAEKIIKDVENSSDYNLFEENRKAFVENYHEMLRNTLVDSGIKSEKWFNNWVKNNQNAIPVVEVSDEEDFGYMSAQRARKLANLQNPFEQIGNSTREIANPLVEMQKTVALYHAIAARNKAAVTFVNGIAKRLETLANGDTVVRGQGVIRRVEVDETNGKEITKPKNDKQIISVYNNGELEFYQVSDKEIFDAINTMTYEQLSTVRKICDKIGSTPASLVRITATMVPDFGIRNFIRDNTEAFFTSENGFLPFLDGIWGVWQFYTNGEWARKYLELNGEFNTLNREEENLARATEGTRSSFKDIWNETKRNASQSKQQMLDSTRANFVRVTDIKDGKFEKAWNDARKSRLAGLVGLCKSPVTGLYEMNKRFNDMLELGTRIAEFKNAAMGYHGTMDRIKNGKLWASNEDIKNAKRDFNYASSKAAQITLDFSQHGTVGGFLNHYIPFFNASLQGIYKTCNALDLMIFGNTMDGKPDSVLRQELIFKTILMGCIGIAVAAAGRGDDDYDEAPEYEKSNYWILPNGIRIPKDQVMGKLIGGTVEKMYNQIADGNFKPTDIVKDIISNFAPDNIMPELLNLGIGYIGNYDTFKQREITPYYMADKLGHLQKDLGTSNFAANLSKTLYDVAGIDISAKKLDWAIQRHLSNMGKYALAVYDAGYKGFNPKEFNERMTRGYDKNDATGSLVGALSEIPVLKTFTTNRTSYTSIDNFYKKYNELKKTSSDEKSMTREEKREWKRYQDANKKMKKYRDQLRAIRQNASLSGTEKRQKADVIFERQLKLVKWAEQK